MTVSETFSIALQHHQAGRLAEAEALYRQTLSVEPRHADALHLLGVLLHQFGRGDGAVEMIRQAIALVPTASTFHSNLGEVYRELGRLDEAVASYRRAIQLQPDFPGAHNNLGNALADLGQFDESIAACRLAIQLKPDFAEAHSSLGNTLKAQSRFDEAVAAYRHAIQLKPGYADAHNNLGVALAAIAQVDEAAAEYRRAIQLSPDDPAVHNNLGVVLNYQGRIDEAIAAFRRAIQLQPDFPQAHGNLLLDLHYLPSPEPEELFREHVRWEEAHARPMAKFFLPHGNDRDPERRLRIGFLSPDFRDHPVAFFLEGFLAAHDRSRLEIFCYADLGREDAMSVRLRQSVGNWRRITGLRDDQVANLIRRDEIDILVDLAGHTSDNRLMVFARKPAPVQVSWLGYPDTTGMKTMDYRLTDAHADPPGATEQWHSEQLVRLPDSAWCYQSAADAPPVSVGPCARAGHVTFGCFNAQQKINGPLLALWGAILQRLPGSHLLLKNRYLGNASVQERMRALLDECGIARERVELVGPIAGSAGHLGAYERMDIALDTFPYHGTTTTCEALWMGVPVVTLAGKTHASRVGVSLLNAISMPELVAHTAEEYVQIAGALGADLGRLSEVRATLRERMQGSPLMDAPRFARNMEDAFRQMWRARCAKQCSTPPS